MFARIGSIIFAPVFQPPANQPSRNHSAQKTNKELTISARLHHFPLCRSSKETRTREREIHDRCHTHSQGHSSHCWHFPSLLAFLHLSPKLTNICFCQKSNPSQIPVVQPETAGEQLIVRRFDYPSLSRKLSLAHASGFLLCSGYSDTPNFSP